MPTVGWILETANDRYWEARSKTAVGFRSPPPMYACSRCSKKFPSADELRRHFHVSHPLELPVLYLRGEPLLQDSVIRSHVTEGDIQVA